MRTKKDAFWLVLGTWLALAGLLGFAQWLGTPGGRAWQCRTYWRDVPCQQWAEEELIAEGMRRMLEDYTPEEVAR